MSQKKICIIEDEEDIVRLLTLNLKREGYEVFSNSSGEDGVTFIKFHKPDLVLLDIMLPYVDGFEICRQIKSDSTLKNTPIIMMSAKGEEANIVTGLELGAEDYITKPFSVAILIARVRAVLRRGVSETKEEATTIKAGKLEMLVDRYEVYYDGKKIELSHSEFRLLKCLAERPGRVFSRAKIIDYMKGENYFVTDRLVDVQLVSIRKKFGQASIIQTVRGVGYKLIDDVE